MGGKELLPETHAFIMALDPSTGLFSFLRLSKMDHGKSSPKAILRTFGASLLKMGMPATSKRPSALMSKWPSGKEVTVEMQGNCKSHYITL